MTSTPCRKHFSAESDGQPDGAPGSRHLPHLPFEAQPMPGRLKKGRLKKGPAKGEPASEKRSTSLQGLRCWTWRTSAPRKSPQQNSARGLMSDEKPPLCPVGRSSEIAWLLFFGRKSVLAATPASRFCDVEFPATSAEQHTTTTKGPAKSIEGPWGDRSRCCPDSPVPFPPWTEPCVPAFVALHRRAATRIPRNKGGKPGEVWSVQYPPSPGW